MTPPCKTKSYLRQQRLQDNRQLLGLAFLFMRKLEPQFEAGELLGEEGAVFVLSGGVLDQCIKLTED